jgi:universal stress protein A
MTVTQHVLVPTDFSAISIDAIRTANGLAFPSTEVTVLHIYNPSALSGPSTRDVYPPPRGLPRDVEFKVMENLERITQGRLDKPSKINLKIEVSRFPAEAICEYAKENLVDLIILTTHGRTGLSHLLMGSVAEAVVRKATCPVLIARSKVLPPKIGTESARTNEKTI